MTVSGLNYGQLMQKAMRRLMADILAVVADEGLHGDHHFLITFETRHPGVVVPEYLLERFPKQMMIVLQHEFSDLAVAGERFSVTLSFDNKPENLIIPFDAIVTFVDPSDEFGLRFDQQDADDDDPEDPPEDDSPTADEEGGGKGGDVVSLDRFRRH